MKEANYKHLGPYPNCLAEDIRHSQNEPPLVITNEEQRKGLAWQVWQFCVFTTAKAIFPL